MVMQPDNRMLATIETVVEIAPIPDADAIVRARVRGWDVVVKMNEFTIGDLCVYFEVDSMLDVQDPRFSFLAPRGVRTTPEGICGHVLKTARLRGQYSQGLALPLSLFPELGQVGPQDAGRDVTTQLGIIKWDPPIPAELMGKVRGYRPSHIPATAEIRIQNEHDALACIDLPWVATEKIDGESTTFWISPGENGVCTRNLDLAPDPENALWRLAAQLDIHQLMHNAALGSHVAIQGETFGEGLSHNPLRLKGRHFAAFTLRVDGTEVPRSRWPQWLIEMSVPIHQLSFPTTMDQALAQAETLKSALSPDRAAEGIVWRVADRDVITLPSGRVTRASFKVVSNRYLLKNDR